MENGENKSNGTVPPKLDPSKTARVSADAESAAVAAPLFPTPKKQTARIDLGLGTAAAGKKTTSRIPLAATMEVKADVSDAQPEAKRETSRIPLALTTEVPETPGAGAPKTIRIKRPSQASTIRLSRPGADSSTEAAAAKSKTSRIDISAAAAAVEAEAAVPTQRKTIKIRRPEGGMKPRALDIAREADAPVAAVAEAPIGRFFAVPLVFSLIIVCVLIYMMAAQAFPDLKLAFPGKLA